jgi:hypothetical protein
LVTDFLPGYAVLLFFWKGKASRKEAEPSSFAEKDRISFVLFRIVMLFFVSKIF